jgi:tetratricopeptide (TPR) repeat protein
MGRAFWLRGDLGASLPWLKRAIELNPNYAQAKYSTAWTEGLLGRGDACLMNADDAIALSPLDPMLYAMLGARAFAQFGSQDYQAAAHSAERAANAPGAHALIEMIAVAAHELAGDRERAAAWAASAKLRAPHLDGGAFLEAFPFNSAQTRGRLSAALSAHGF